MVGVLHSIGCGYIINILNINLKKELSYKMPNGLVANKYYLSEYPKAKAIIAYEELQTKLKIKKVAKIFTHIMKMVKETYR